MTEPVIMAPGSVEEFVVSPSAVDYSASISTSVNGVMKWATSS